MFKPDFFDKEKGKFICASPTVKGYPRILFNVYYKPGATTVQAECRSITLMNARSESDNQIFVTGGPGSGKTTTAMSLVPPVISDSTNIAVAVKQDKTDANDVDLKYEDNAEDAEEEPVGKAKVAWTTGKNNLADYAPHRASLACPDKVMARLLPWKREFTNLMRINDVEPRVTDTSVNPKASNAIVGLSKHTDSYKAKRFEDTHLTRVHASLSEMARRIVQDKSDDWPLILVARQEALKDPEAYALNRAKHEEAYRNLLEHAVSLIDIAVGTPVSLADLRNLVS